MISVNVISSINSHTCVQNHVFFFLERVTLCSFAVCPGTHSINQTGFDLRDPSASAS